MTLEQTYKDDTALARASAWNAREQANDMTPAENAEFQAWLDADEKNKAAYALVSNAAKLLNTTDTQKIRSEFCDAEPSLASLFEECDDLVSAAQGTQTSGARRGWSWLPAIAASVLAVTAALFLFYTNRMSSDTYETAVGERQTVLLKDGSTLILNTDTHLSVALTGSERRVLLKQGEAYFDVAKDSGRPFSVIVGDNAVKALGTAFNVRRRGNSTRVTLVEGAVEVKKDEGLLSTATGTASSLKAPITLKPGDDLIIEPQGPQLASLSPEGIKHTTSWRTGMIYYSNVPLSTIVKEVQYYAEKELIIANDEVGDLIAGGSFNTSNVPSFLKGLEAAFPVRIIERNKAIVLSLASDDLDETPRH